MEIKIVTYRAPHSPLSIYSLFQDAAQGDLNDSFVSCLSLELPGLVPTQEYAEITESQQQRQGGAYFFCYLLSVIRVENLNASPDIFSIIIFSNRPLFIEG